MTKGQSSALEQSAAKSEVLNKEADKLAAKLQKILKDGDADNKDKISQVVTIYNDEIIDVFSRAYNDLIQMGMDTITNEYLNEFHDERLRASGVLTEKY